MNKFLIIVIFLSCLGAEEKYDLIWRFRNGLVNIMPQKFTIEKKLYLISPNGDKTKVETEEGVVNNTIYWKVENVINDSQALVVNLVKDGKIKIKKNGETHKLSMTNPLKNMDKALQPPFKNYQALTHGGMAFLLDIEQQKVLVTWILHIQEDGSYKKEMFKGKQDPHGMSGQYQQLINQKVSIGTEWDMTRTDFRGFTYKNHYTFERITSYKGKPVAEVKAEGEIFLGNNLIGRVNGYYYHDYKTRLMLFYEMNEQVDQIIIRKDENNQEKKYLLEIHVKNEFVLQETNAKLK
ncbi:hypothetical protein [Candidatus Uabimicrobium sp. HlEnr_7]|uniref:hypothetical protein n=1 Tax=Candidatus Uabimicrobium helgolandensis TaxID=3095367 RepID=UPI003557942D